jgi:hypothetical protein
MGGHRGFEDPVVGKEQTMHESLDPDIKLHLDHLEEVEGAVLIQGWCASPVFPIDKIEAWIGDAMISEGQYGLPRIDVFLFYQSAWPAFLNSGFRLKVPKASSDLVLLAIDGLGNRHKVFSLAGTDEESQAGEAPLALTGDAHSGLVVVDDFYRSPDSLRRFALRCEFVESPQAHKGRRTREVYRNDTLKATFESLLQRRITRWDYMTNGVFQCCTAEDRLVYHMDLQTYAAAVFLTPNAPLNSGTSFFRSKDTGLRRAPSDSDVLRTGLSKERLLRDTFKNGHYDNSNLDLVDTVANVYNRLVLWDARLIHSASSYFGDSLETGRLFQLFFFDAE